MEMTPDTALASMLSASLAASQLPVIIDAEQAATLLHCSSRQIDFLADHGHLPAKKFGRGWIFVTAQLIHCVLKQCAENMPAAVEGSSQSPPDASTGIRRSRAKPMFIGAPQPPRGRGRPPRPIPDSVRQA
jgi:hypothetical protein